MGLNSLFGKEVHKKIKIWLGRGSPIGLVYTVRLSALFVTVSFGGQNVLLDA